LIDADILLYEVGFKSQSKNEEGDIVPLPEEMAYAKFDESVRQICADVHSTEAPLLFFTGKGNFRNDILKDTVYKGTRHGKDKPYHYSGLLNHAKESYYFKLVDGLEADDLLCTFQQDRLGALDTIICSRDKDLKIQPGMHYSWEVGGQPRFGPTRVSEIGTLRLRRGGKDLFGTGRRFFYAQCLMGDKTDNIPGVGGYGPVKAYKALVECKTMQELEDVVVEIYKKKFGDEWEDKLLQRARCLWMTRELNEDGSPVLWNLGAYMEEDE